MAEPEDRGVVSMRLTREFSVSRMEKQLLVKLYCLLVPVVQGRCQLPPLAVEGLRGCCPIGKASTIKGA